MQNINIYMYLKVWSMSFKYLNDWLRIEIGIWHTYSTIEHHHKGTSAVVEGKLNTQLTIGTVSYRDTTRSRDGDTLILNSHGRQCHIVYTAYHRSSGHFVTQVALVAMSTSYTDRHRSRGHFVTQLVLDTLTHSYTARYKCSGP